MTYIIIIISLFVITLLIPPTRRTLSGICSSTLQQTVFKRRNKQKILDLLRAEKELGNEEIRSTLNCSRRSVIRYLDELEKESLVEQIGQSGRNVSYRLKGE